MTKLDLSDYEGAGIRIKNEHGEVVEIKMDEKQQRQHDKSYRQYLINTGKLKPSKNNGNGFHR